MASAGPYASLYLALQTDNHASTPPLSFFTGRMPFLPPNQQRQGSEGSKLKDTIVPQNINKLLQAAEYNVIQQLYQFALKS